VKRAVPFVVIAMAMGLAPAPDASAGPLDDARRALATATFTGRMLVSWADGDTVRETAITVRADRGDIEFDGPVPIVKTFASHLVRMSTGWSDLAPGDELGHPTTGKYSVRRTAGPEVTGRPTVAVEIRRGARLRERMALDQALGVVLRREQLDDAGRLVRRVEFTSFEPGPTTRHFGHPSRPRPETPARMRADVPAPYRAPVTLDEGYRRVGAYRRGAVVQIVYGDGVYGLSVFEQPGHLAWDELPAAGRAMEIAGHRARTYVWPGGQLVTWQAGGSTFTVVGDGPPAEVLAAAASIRSARPLSTGQRVRQAARELVDALSGRD
jgi:hypothetical protein